ncbi:hypothetical protein WDZ92_28475, partial [Nostoc sp. NIES-2111]
SPQVAARWVFLLSLIYQSLTPLENFGDPIALFGCAMTSLSLTFGGSSRLETIGNVGGSQVGAVAGSGVRRGTGAGSGNRAPWVFPASQKYSAPKYLAA